MKIPRLAGALALLAASTLAPCLRAQDEKSIPVPWVELEGTERKCIDIEITIGGRICHKWDAVKRSFLLEKGGQAYFVFRTERVDSRGPLTVPTVVSRSGQLSREDVRALRSLLANIGIAGQTGRCNPFGNLFQSVPFQEGASYELTWHGPGAVTVEIPLESGFTGNPCPQGILRLLHRINLLTAKLPPSPPSS
jgi:hypothetical protein